MHSIIRIDEVDKQGTSKISKVEGGNVASVPDADLHAGRTTVKRTLRERRTSTSAAGQRKHLRIIASAVHRGFERPSSVRTLSKDRVLWIRPPSTCWSCRVSRAVRFPPRQADPRAAARRWRVTGETRGPIHLFRRSRRRHSPTEPRASGRICSVRREGRRTAASSAQRLLFVVPRPGTISPWSSKATDIAHGLRSRRRRSDRARHLLRD